MKVASACEAGTGEGTTLKFIESYSESISLSGFDISLSRLLYAQLNCTRDVNFICADMNNIPLGDASVDAILTNHSIEPNGGNEDNILSELLRVSARYLVMIEPDYERAGDEQKKRMQEHNYVTGSQEKLKCLPGNILHYEPWPWNHRPENAASLTIFEKKEIANAAYRYISPISKMPLNLIDNLYHCDEDGFAYPVVKGIPCLRDDYGILASHLPKLSSSKEDSDV